MYVYICIYCCACESVLDVWNVYACVHLCIQLFTSTEPMQDLGLEAYNMYMFKCYSY